MSMLKQCWEYDGTIDDKGYGRASWQGKLVRTHRAAYEAIMGPIPKGLHIDHLCFNPRCYNPHHLEPVTPQENIARSWARRQKMATPGQKLKMGPQKKGPQKRTCGFGHLLAEPGARCWTCRSKWRQEIRRKAKLLMTQ